MEADRVPRSRSGSARKVGLRGEYRFDSVEERNGSRFAATDPMIVGGM